MSKRTLYALDFDSKAGEPGHRRAYRLLVTDAWARRHDNGCLVSIGLRIPEDLTHAQLAKMPNATPCPWPEAIHAGCGSACVLRGDERCKW